LRSEVRYVGLGIFIGMLSAGVLILVVLSVSVDAAALVPVRAWIYSPTQAAPTAMSIPATPSETPPPTITTTSTLSPSPTATQTSMEKLIAAGQLVVVGPLDEQRQIIALYESAIKFIAPTTAESRSLGETLNGKGYGSPSLICGPLSMAILRDAGIVSSDVTLHQYWLLNPKIREDRKLLETAFPEDRFEHHVNKNPLSRIDWQSYPLLPGDFLYIEEGTGGNFDHMLVVDRVDAQSRAYAVTNYNTEAGFVIDEILLYDPAEPSLGIFRRWTAKVNALLGSTGFGGFELWRLRNP